MYNYRMERKSRKNIILLGLVSFFTDVSSEMIYPLLPIFFATSLGLSRSFIGLIEGIAESSSSFFKLFSGWFSDRIRKRKKIVILGYTLSNFTKPIFGIVHSGIQALGVRFLDRVGKGIRTSPRDALISLSINKEERGKAFGIHRTMDTLGAVVGPLLAFLLIPLFKGNMRPVFLISFIPGLFAVMILSGVKDIQGKSYGKKISLPFIKTLKEFSPSFRYFLFVMFLFSLGNSSNAFLLLRAKDVGLKISLIPLFYMGFNISYATFSLPAGLISDKWGRKKVIELSFLLYALIYLGFAFVNKISHLWILMLSYGLFYGMSDGNLRAMVGDLVGKNHTGTAFGVYHTITGIALFLSSVIMGILWDKVGVESAFIFGAIMSGISFLLLIIYKKLD